MYLRCMVDIQLKKKISSLTPTIVISMYVSFTFCMAGHSPKRPNFYSPTPFSIIPRHLNHVATMSFRKRNAVISTSSASQAATPKTDNAPVPGVRPSPHDSRPITSTGTPSLDNLLAGHAGLPLGTSLLIEEHGTTDFSGVLLRYYAA